MRRSLAGPVLNSLRNKQIAQVSLSRQYATPVEYTPQQKDPQLGDYPQLPFVSTQLRPPLGWWDVQMRRNYGELIHEEDDGLNMWTPDPPVVEPGRAFRLFAIAWTGIVVLGTTIYYNVPERPCIPREYPYDGLVRELGGLEVNKANPEVDSEDGN